MSFDVVAEAVEVKPVLKSFFSPDAERLESFAPPDDQPWAIYVQLLVGPEESSGEESFGVTLCNPAWVQEQARAQGVLVGRHHLVVASFEWPRILAFIESFLQRCQGGSWPEVAEQVGRLGHWEFEDYQE